MRPDERRDAQILAIVASLAAILLVRLLVMPDPGPVELVPVLAAAWWFGTRPAVAAGVAASVVMLAAAVWADPYEVWTLLFRVPLVVGPGWLLGRLRDERERTQDELNRLRVIQDALAPVQAPDLPLLEVATRYVPAERGVAGDFYLVAEGHNNSTVFVVGDVVGKGIDAAKRATFARATLTACAPYSDNPVHLLRVTNAELIRQHGASAEFITMVCVVVRPDSSMVWASAGHPPPLSLTDGEPIGTFKPSYPLGIAPELPVVGYHAHMPEAGILLYTDGVTDARPRRQSYEPFGRARLTRLIDEHNRPSPEEAVDRVVRAAEVFSRGRLPDDLCVVAVRSKLAARWTRSMAERVETVAPASDRERETAPAS